MTRFCVFLAALVLCIGANAKCKLEILAPAETTALAGDRRVSLGDSDSPTSPHAWLGPLQFGQCSLEMGIIEAPLVYVAPNFLYVASYSGSNRTLQLVDLDHCAVKWTSKRFTGKVVVQRQAIVLGGVKVPLKACLPP